MPTDRKRYMLTPDEETLVVLGLDPDITKGATGPALNGILRRYADQFHAAAARLDSMFRPNVWSLFADVLRHNEYPAYEDSFPANVAIAHAIEREHKKRQVGDDYLLSDHEHKRLTGDAIEARAAERVKELCQELRELTAVHGDAILAAVHWYWLHHERPPLGSWWLAGTRKKWFEARRAEAEADAAERVTPRQPTLFSTEAEPDGEAKTG